MTETTPPTRSALSRQSIIDAAVAQADSGGIETVTIRRVAGKLDVTPMALYWHFRNKDELLAGMADWVYGAMEVELDPAASWQDRLRALVEAEIAVLRAHPALAALVVSYGGVQPNILSTMEAALGILFDAGFSPAEAVQIVQHVELTTVNLVLREPGGVTGESGEAREQEAQAALLSLPEDTYPNVHRAAGPLSQCSDPTEYYEFGVGLLMAGVEEMANRRYPARNE